MKPESIGELHHLRTEVKLAENALSRFYQAQNEQHVTEVERMQCQESGLHHANQLWNALDPLAVVSITEGTRETEARIIEQNPDGSHFWLKLSLVNEHIEQGRIIQAIWAYQPSDKHSSELVKKEQVHLKDIHHGNDSWIDLERIIEVRESLQAFIDAGAAAADTAVS